MLYSATASCWRLGKSKPNGDIRNFQGSKNKVILVFPAPMNAVYWPALYASCKSLLAEIT